LNAVVILRSFFLSLGDYLTQKAEAALGPVAPKAISAAQKAASIAKPTLQTGVATGSNLMKEGSKGLAGQQ
jgi:hypothetical protein